MSVYDLKVRQHVGRPAAEGDTGLRKFFKENGLSTVCFSFFALFLVGQSVAGWLEYNEDARAHGQALVRYLPYLLTGHFYEATFENWESEFLQMAAFVMFTACLYQKGSAESRKLDGENP